ncbi:hypothetical protein HDU76_006853 [Blyttiomyces sp. JEL0837]|nr:hypothetical protein HDU76_006853 [Blyttiomyces sp. JEL0837]
MFAKHVEAHSNGMPHDLKKHGFKTGHFVVEMGGNSSHSPHGTPVHRENHHYQQQHSDNLDAPPTSSRSLSRSRTGSIRDKSKTIMASRRSSYDYNTQQDQSSSNLTTPAIMVTQADNDQETMMNRLFANASSDPNMTLPRLPPPSPTLSVMSFMSEDYSSSAVSAGDNGYISESGLSDAFERFSTQIASPSASPNLEGQARSDAEALEALSAGFVSSPSDVASVVDSLLSPFMNVGSGGPVNMPSDEPTGVDEDWLRVFAAQSQQQSQQASLPRSSPTPSSETGGFAINPAGQVQSYVGQSADDAIRNFLLSRDLMPTSTASNLNVPMDGNSYRSARRDSGPSAGGPAPLLARSRSPSPQPPHHQRSASMLQHPVPRRVVGGNMLSPPAGSGTYGEAKRSLSLPLATEDGRLAVPYFVPITNNSNASSSNLTSRRSHSPSLLTVQQQQPPQDFFSILNAGKSASPVEQFAPQLPQRFSSSPTEHQSFLETMFSPFAIAAEGSNLHSASPEAAIAAFAFEGGGSFGNANANAVNIGVSVDGGSGSGEGAIDADAFARSCNFDDTFGNFANING